ncbi:MAG: flavin monoamine oxidase family protein [Tepidisphaeraceae bacterium]|jgi:monoamine oxidase
MPENQHEQIILNGLPSGGKKKKIVVIGAGIAGLSAGYELVRAGHDVTILEAKGHVGGRVQTIREPFENGLYAEAGAMRIPSAHNLTMAYVKKFGLQLMPFTMGNPKAYLYVNGARHRAGDADAQPDCLGFDLGNSVERGKTAKQLWLDALSPIMNKLKAEGNSAWPAIVKQYDHLTTHEFLESRGWSEGAIEMFGVLENLESRMNVSFVEVLLAELGHAFTDMFQVVGGMDHLPRSFLPLLAGRIRFGCAVCALDQTEEKAIIHYNTLGGRRTIEADHAIVTLPFSVLRHVEVLKPFSRGKRRAIRQLHYDASGKIFFQCRRRFWEEDDGIFGGGTYTDLAIRTMWYPEHGRETGRGVLLASYTWADDAQRWGSLTPGDRISEALEDVAQIHPQVNEEFEVGASKMWHEDEYACGAFALFEPEQTTLLYQDIISSEGRFHFAGEHASLTHRWMQGSIESALRAVEEIAAAP